MRAAAVNEGILHLQQPDGSIAFRGRGECGVRNLEVLHVIAEQSWTFIVVREGSFDVAKADIARVAAIEAVSRQRTKHAVFGITISLLGNRAAGVGGLPSANERQANIIE